MVRNAEYIRIDIESRVRNTERYGVTSIYLYGYGIRIVIGTSEYDFGNALIPKLGLNFKKSLADIYSQISYIGKVLAMYK